MAHKAIGLETQEFLDYFFPFPADKSHDDCPQWPGDVFEKLKNAKDLKIEAQLSEYFIGALASVDELTPGLKLAESQHAPDKEDESGLKVDAAFFRPDFVPNDGRPHWADQVICVEFKAQGNDPYDDRPTESLDASADKRKGVRGQIIDYAEQVFLYQHRTALYMLLIVGKMFRMLRWDRSGTIVTRAVDYTEHPDVLLEMLWRMSLQNDEQLGLDPSAERLLETDDGYKSMDAAAVPRPSDVDHTADRKLAADEIIPDNFVFRYVREEFRKTLASGWPRYCLEVPDGETVRKFLVAKPAFRSYGMAGRGTRGYVAFDLKTERFVWLKDAWRVHYELVDQEGTVLDHLNTVGVLYVPTLACHGDIRDQTTRTPEFWELKNPLPAPIPATSSSSATLLQVTPARKPSEPSAPPPKTLKRRISELDDSDDAEPREDCPLRRHKHYRIVVQEVCMPLIRFESGKQLLQIVLTCIIAHRDAVLNAKIMHRDVSGGNILILPSIVNYPVSGNRQVKWLGILADWELSKPVLDKRITPQARQPASERTGTWQYMSVATLNNHSKVVETSDELESFLYVVLYHGVRYLPSNCKDVGDFIDGFFDSYTVMEGKFRCGYRKSQAMSDGEIELDSGETGSDDTQILLKFDSPLDDYLTRVLPWFEAHYAVIKYDKSQNAKKVADLLRPSITTTAPVNALKRRTAVSYLRMGTLDVPEEPVEPPAPEVKKPTDIQRALARQIQNHNYMARVLVNVIEDPRWLALGKDRVVGDNVPIDFRPERIVAPIPMVSTNTLKRRCTRATISAPVSRTPNTGTSSSSKLPRKPRKA
ncbi:hypothetical protein C2E23DRAFT_888169 [Lenzites betulinus]|nr:hypothetical protein C2E23DRAFT_888169 [Lenzites betulinus]